MQNTFTDPAEYLQQSIKYNDAIMRLSELQKEYQKALVLSIEMQNTFTDPAEYLQQSIKYNDAIMRLSELQKEYQNAKDS